VIQDVLSEITAAGPSARFVALAKVCGPVTVYAQKTRIVTWPESVDEALCVGWIDGIRRSVDESRYTIRFTPRKPRSIWSAVNIRRARALDAEQRMQPAGLAAFAARRENRSGIYSYEQRQAELEEPYAGILRENRAAWAFFRAQPPGLRKQVIWWVVSARKEETRLKRLKKLVDESARGKRILQ
jgi:uncharacterized protein YdeI (YjbR/CyaY-like superfamily)